MDTLRTEFSIVDYIRPISGPIAVVANAATIRADPIRGGRIALTRVVVAPDFGASGALVILYTGTPSPDRIIDSQTIVASSPAAIFEFSRPLVLQEFESVTAVVTSLGATATNVYLTLWGQLIRPKSAKPFMGPDTEGVGIDPMPWDDEVKTKREDDEDAAIALARPHRADVY